MRLKARQENLTGILETELAAHGIAVGIWKRNNAGEADFTKGTVDIPKPKNDYTLGVAFHEIGHIFHNRQNASYITLPEYHMEYTAEIFAIAKLREYGLQTREYRAYATKYVLTCLSRYKNRGGDMSIVPKEIIKWTGLKMRKWNEARRITVRDEVVSHIADIRIDYK